MCLPHVSSIFIIISPKNLDRTVYVGVCVLKHYWNSNEECEFVDHLVTRVFKMISLAQITTSKHLTSPPYMLYALPISFFLILSPG